jgi:hypothetical protein
MARNGTGEVLRSGERVIATVPLPGVPEGSEGRVNLVEGLSWIRYWVRFRNGVVMGSIHRDKLARPKEWVEIKERRARAAEEPAPEEEAAAAGTEEAAGEEVPVATGAAARIPAHLLERSRQARARANAG